MRDVFNGDENWRNLTLPRANGTPGIRSRSTSRSPPYFDGMPARPAPLQDVHGARAIAVLGDSVTTDHISPAGSISKSQPGGEVSHRSRNRAGRFQLLWRAARQSRGDGARNVREHSPAQCARSRQRRAASRAICRPDEELSIFDAAMKYKADGTPLIVLAGKEYGSGSSRDWAAKGPYLLGIKAVIADSFERIHRSNLIGMGVLPLEYVDGADRSTYGLTGEELLRHYRHSSETWSRGCARASKPPTRRAADRSSSTCEFASTRPTRPNITATAGFCSTSCVSCDQEPERSTRPNSSAEVPWCTR